MIHYQNLTHLTILALVPEPLHVSHVSWTSPAALFAFALVGGVIATGVSFTYSSVVATNVELQGVWVAMKLA